MSVLSGGFKVSQLVARSTDVMIPGAPSAEKERPMMQPLAAVENAFHKVPYTSREHVWMFVFMCLCYFCFACIIK